MITSVAALFVHQINPQGIRLFLDPPFLADDAAPRGRSIGRNIPLHRGTMIGTYIGAILIAGGFTFVPGGIMASLRLTR